MRAVGLDFSARRLTERGIPDPAPGGSRDVLFRVEEVGVCATDRELAQFHFGRPPRGESFLVLGHEVLGRVVEAGPQAEGFRPGDWVVAVIRRACEPACDACRSGRRDICETGRFSERGIFGMHGYFTEYAVDSAADLTVVPPDLVEIAVLAEPLSVVEKAVARALRIRGEIPKTALVLGAGSIGLLAALALLRRGVEVTVASLEPSGHARPRLARDAGARYIEVGQGTPGRFDLAVEATGSAGAAYQAIGSLGRLGVCAILGGSAGAGSISFTDLLVNNQAVFGSVNASPESFLAAIRDLADFDRGLLRRMIRRLEFSAFESSIASAPPDVPKLVHVIH